MKFITNFLNKIKFVFAILVVLNASKPTKKSSTTQHSNVRISNFIKGLDGAGCLKNDNLQCMTKLDINCGDQSVIQGFLLKRDAKDYLYRYNYACPNDNNEIKKAITNNKINLQSNKGKEKGHNLFSLVNIKVKCEDGQALNQFKLKKLSLNFYRYDYTCIEVNCGKTQTLTTEKKDNLYNFYDLVSFDVRVQENQAIKGFVLKKKDTSFWYEVEFCELNTNINNLPQEPKNPNSEKNPNNQQQPTHPTEPTKPIQQIKQKEQIINFCAEICQPNPEGELHKCTFQDDFLKLCRRCKPSGNQNAPDNIYLCGLYCDSYLDGNTCEFFGFNNEQLKLLDKEKKISEWRLNQYGITLKYKN